MFYVQVFYATFLLFNVFKPHKFEDSRYNSDLQLLSEELLQYKAMVNSMNEWSIKSKIKRKKRSDKRVCYGEELGCFEDNGPFGYLDMLPSSPEEINTKFLIYTTKDRSEKPFLEFHFTDIVGANAVGGNQTVVMPESMVRIHEKIGNIQARSAKIIVHGFGSSCSHVWIYEMRAALMAVEDCIVICIDWEKGAALPNYVKAAANTRLVGKQLAIFLQMLVDKSSLLLSNVHVVGFSLGAHVSGYAGSELTGLRRITGLDPAGPLFESQHPKARLDETDAEFVDVIHSNGENLILGGLGSWQPMGDADFYPNGGKIQHGCSNIFVGAVTDIIWAPTTQVEGRSLCNHRRAYKFFIDSVAPRCLFPAFPCNSFEEFSRGHCFVCHNLENANDTSHCGRMGYYADKSTGRGQLYLKTREEEPFCAHQYRIEIHSELNELPLRTNGRIEIILEDSGLTEAFTITEKDDTELFAGDVISQVLVPHPALGFPRNLTITYIVYKGWLTKGLSSWNINKIVLSDSEGKKYSICEPIELRSEVPKHLRLQPNECEADIEVPDEELGNDVDETTTQKLSAPLPPFSSNETQTNQISSNESEEIELNTNEYFRRNSSRNSKKHKRKSEQERSFVHSEDNEGDDDDLGIDEDQLVAAAMGISVKSNEPSVVGGGSGGSPLAVTEEKTDTITVQLFPYRLADIFEKAERYARQTILPLLSEQFPKIFTSNISERRKDNQPPNMAEDPIQFFGDLSPIQKTKKKLSTPVVTSPKLDITPPSPAPVTKVEMARSNYDSIRPPSVNAIEKIFSELERNRQQQLATERPKIYIDLPTFRPRNNAYNNKFYEMPASAGTESGRDGARSAGDHIESKKNENQKFIPLTFT